MSDVESARHEAMDAAADFEAEAARDGHAPHVLDVDADAGHGADSDPVPEDHHHGHHAAAAHKEHHHADDSGRRDDPMPANDPGRHDVNTDSSGDGGERQVAEAAPVAAPQAEPEEPHVPAIVVVAAHDAEPAQPAKESEPADDAAAAAAADALLETAAKRRSSKAAGEQAGGTGTGTRRKTKRPSAVVAETLATEAAEAKAKKNKKNKKGSVSAGASGAADPLLGAGAMAAGGVTVDAAAVAAGSGRPAAASSDGPPPPPAYDDPIGLPASYDDALKMAKVKQRTREASDDAGGAGPGAAAAAAAATLTVAAGGAAAAVAAGGPASAGASSNADGTATSAKPGRNIVNIKDTVARSKATWSFHRGLMFTVFLLFAMYDLATDALVFYNSYVFIRSVNVALTNSSVQVYDNPYTNASYLFEPDFTTTQVGNSSFPSTYYSILSLEPCVQDIVIQLYNISVANDTTLLPPVSDDWDFWHIMDEQTNGSCNFHYLYAADTFEDAYNSMNITVWVCLAFFIVSFFTFVYAIYTNWKYRYYGSSKTLLTFLLFFLEDIPQMIIQLNLFARRLQLTCYTCVPETDCGLGPNAAARWTAPQGDCTGTPSLASLNNVGSTDNLSVFFNSLLNPLLLLYLSLGAIALSTVRLYGRALDFKFWDVWLILYIVLCPLILGCLWLPVLWTVYAFLLPTLGLSESPARSGVFIAAIVCSVAFPFVAYIMYRNVRKSILGGNEQKAVENRIQKVRQSLANSPTTMEMGTLRTSHPSDSSESSYGGHRKSMSGQSGGSHRKSVSDELGPRGPNSTNSARTTTSTGQTLLAVPPS